MLDESGLINSVRRYSELILCFSFSGASISAHRLFLESGSDELVTLDFCPFESGAVDVLTFDLFDGHRGATAFELGVSSICS